MRLILGAVLASFASSPLAQDAPVVNESTGEASYTYAFPLPAARSRFQPSLALHYSSANQQNVGYGVGWSLSTVRIEKNAKASPTAAWQYWLVRDDGTRQVLVASPRDGAGHYNAAVESSYFDVTGGPPNNLNTWSAKDAVGTTYSFACLESQCTRWFLVQVTDPDQNITAYSYLTYANGGAGFTDVLLQSIQFNNYSSNPSSTAAVGATGLFATKIDLEYETDPSPAYDASSGSVLEHTQRLKYVRIKNQGSVGLVTVKTYSVSYGSAAFSGRSLLESITERGGDATGPGLPPTTFYYDGSSYYWLAPGTPISLPAGDMTAHAGFLALIDLDGDHRPDLVLSPGGWSNGVPSWVGSWARNITVPGSATLQFDTPVAMCTGNCTPNFGMNTPSCSCFTTYTCTTSMCPGLFPGVDFAHQVYPGRGLIDMNGDGVPDIVSVLPSTSADYPGMLVCWGIPAGSQTTYLPTNCDVIHTFIAPGYYEFLLQYVDSTGNVRIALRDMNGDGLPDYVVWTPSGWLVYFLSKGSSGWTFGNPVTYWPPGQGFPLDNGLCGLRDMNGDGFPDYVCASSGTTPVVGSYLGSGQQLQSSFVDWGPVTPSTGYSWAGLYEAYDANRATGVAVDLNGDGLMDYVWAPVGANGLLYVAPGSGSGYEGPNAWRGQATSRYDETTGGTLPVQLWAYSAAELWWSLGTAGGFDNGEFIDADGDGLMDYVQWDHLTGQMWFYRGFTSGSNSGAPVVLSHVVTPLGATYDLTYTPSTTFIGLGQAPLQAVVTSVAVSGPAMASNVVTYGYASPSKAPSFDDPTRLDYRGFAESWTQDAVTQVVKHTWWENGSYAFMGQPARAEWGVPVQGAAQSTGQPPRYTVFRRIDINHTARSIASGACTAPASASGGPLRATEISQSAYPVTAFTSSATDTRFVDAVQLSSQAIINCQDVDAWGNVLKVTNYPTAPVGTTAPLDGYVQNTYYWVDVSPAATCKNCVVTTGKSDLAGKNDLGDEYIYRYTQSYQLSSIDQLVSVTSLGSRLQTVYLHLAGWTYNGNGTVATVGHGCTAAGSGCSIIESFDYDAYQLRITQHKVAEGATALEADTFYDDRGLPTIVTGPYLVGAAVPVQQVAYAYDPFGRLRAVSQQPIANGIVPQALAAFQYADYIPGSGYPASATSYSFAVPLTYSDGSIPETGDVQQTTVFVDGLGRTIQSRERLGGSSSGDASAQISQNLSQSIYRVAAVILDGAGRVQGSLEPFYAQNAGFRNYTGPSAVANDAGSGTIVRATLASYDAQSRLTCRKSLVVPGTLPSSAGSCVSSFGEDANHASATAFSYRGVTQNTSSYLGVKVVPPELTSTSGAGSESFYGASGRLAWVQDSDSNAIQQTYDPLGHLTAVIRQAAGGLKTVTTTFSYDLAGRLTQRVDPNLGTLQYYYDSVKGYLNGVILPAHAVGNGLSGSDHIDFGYSLGRLATVDQCQASSTIATDCSCAYDCWCMNGCECDTYPVVTSGCTRTATLTYDTPYGGNATYQYTAGRLASASNQNTTMAFGYDGNGSVAIRDQWFAGVSGGFAVQRANTADGRPLQTTLSAPVSSSGYSVHYDSLGRPVLLDSGLGVHWSLPYPGPTGAYDAVGQPSRSTLDNGRVSATISYGSYSAIPTAASVSLPSGPLYSVNQMVFQGDWLKSYTDQVSNTGYAYQYDNASRLASAVASPTAANPLAENYAQLFSFNVTKSLSEGPSVGNVERVVDQALAPALDQSYGYATTSIPPGPDAVTSITTNGLTGTLAYDSVGHVTQKGNGDTFTYDVESRLTSITPQSGQGEVIGYGPLGDIVRRQIGDTVFYYLGRDATIKGTVLVGCQGPTCSVDPQSVSVDAHLMVGQQRVASVRSGPGAASRTVYFFRDQLGSVVATSLAGGVSGANYRYGPYGEQNVTTNESADSASELGYTGALRLSGGLVYLGARIYDPSLRRFIQADTVDPLSYTYVGGDPINRTDPTGLGWTAYVCIGDCTPVGGGGDDVPGFDPWSGAPGPHTGPYGGGGVYGVGGLPGGWLGRGGQSSGSSGCSPSYGGCGGYGIGPPTTATHVWGGASSPVSKPPPPGFSGYRTSAVGMGAPATGGGRYWLLDVSDFFAGMGSVLSFGLTDVINDATGASGIVNRGSNWYTAGQIAGIGVSVTSGGAAGALKGASRMGQAGIEFSHAVPRNALMKLGLGEGRSLLNGNYVSVVEHALNDPARYRFMPSAWKAMNPINPIWQRAWNRVPFLLKGTAAGAAYGGASVCLTDWCE